MGKLGKKYLLAFLLTLGFTAVVYAANTKFTNVEVTGSLTVDGATTHTGNVTSTGNATATGTLTRTGATTLSTTTFTGGFAPWSRTIAQLNALTASTTGQVVFCADCVRSALCVSSGSVTAGAWTVMDSTATTPAYTTIHCQ